MRVNKKLSMWLMVTIFIITSCSNKYEESMHVDKISKVENMLEIQNVISAYAMAWDREDTKEFANHFHEDALIIDSWNEIETERFNGVQAFMDARQEEGDNVGGHTLSLVHFKQLGNETASTEVIFNYFWYGNFITSTSKVNIRGSYIDDWVKTEKGWRIIKRIIEHENVPAHRAERYGMTE